MSMTKRMLEEQGYFDKPLKTRECPRCGGMMEECEQDASGMTDGQISDLECGFNTPFECESCGYYALYDIGHREEIFGWEDPEIDELVKITRIDPKSFEEVIIHALRSNCFIEAVSLIHNVIEAYLKKKIEDLTNNDKTRLELLKKKFNPRYLRDYNTISYLLGIIDNPMYQSILDFNDKRNKVIHELMTNPKDLEQIKKIARDGREIQMKLSPLNLTNEDIKIEMEEFDLITT